DNEKDHVGAARGGSDTNRSAPSERGIIRRWPRHRSITSEHESEYQVGAHIDARDPPCDGGAQKKYRSSAEVPFHSRGGTGRHIETHCRPPCGEDDAEGRASSDCQSKMSASEVGESPEAEQK